MGKRIEGSEKTPAAVRWTQLIQESRTPPVVSATDGSGTASTNMPDPHGVMASAVESAVTALTTAATELATIRRAIESRWERRIFVIAVAIARKILDRELTRTSPISPEKIAGMLECAVGSAPVRLLLNPDDLAFYRSVAERNRSTGTENTMLAGTVSADLPEWLRTLCGDGPERGILSVQADPRLERGACRIELPHGSMEAGPETELRRILEEWESTEPS